MIMNYSDDVHDGDAYEEISDHLEQINEHLQAIWRTIEQLSKDRPGKPAGPVVRSIDRRT